MSSIKEEPDEMLVLEVSNFPKHLKNGEIITRLVELMGSAKIQKVIFKRLKSKELCVYIKFVNKTSISIAYNKLFQKSIDDIQLNVKYSNNSVLDSLSSKRVIKSVKKETIQKENDDDNIDDKDIDDKSLIKIPKRVDDDNKTLHEDCKRNNNSDIKTAISTTSITSTVTTTTSTVSKYSSSYKSLYDKDKDENDKDNDNDNEQDDDQDDDNKSKKYSSSYKSLYDINKEKSDNSKDGIDDADADDNRDWSSYNNNNDNSNYSSQTKEVGVSDQDTRELRLLIPSSDAGELIGKKGATINRIRSACNCHISISNNTHSISRICTIRGTFNDIMTGINLIIDRKLGDKSVTILIEHKNVGYVVGRKGAAINAVTDISKAYVAISKEVLPNSSEKTIYIDGFKANINKALKLVLKRVFNNPTYCKTRMLYDPQNDRNNNNKNNNKNNKNHRKNNKNSFNKPKQSNKPYNTSEYNRNIANNNRNITNNNRNNINNTHNMNDPRPHYPPQPQYSHNIVPSNQTHPPYSSQFNVPQYNPTIPINPPQYVPQYTLAQYNQYQHVGNNPNNPSNPNINNNINNQQQQYLSQYNNVLQYNHQNTNNQATINNQQQYSTQYNQNQVQSQVQNQVQNQVQTQTQTHTPNQNQNQNQTNNTDGQHTSIAYNAPRNVTSMPLLITQQPSEATDNNRYENRICITFLEGLCREIMIRQYFERFGQVRIARIICDGNGKSTNTGFVSFVHAETVQSVLYTNEHVVEGKRIHIRRATYEDRTRINRHRYDNDRNSNDRERSRSRTNYSY